MDDHLRDVIASQPASLPPTHGSTPIDTKNSAIHLPADQYLHPDAPTEWWWHTGTLTAGDRVFGFEINAARFTSVLAGPYGFTQVMLTDVAAQKHYAASVGFDAAQGFKPNNWAETDPAKPWWVKLGDVSMHAPQADPTRNMHVVAKLDSPGDKDNAKGLIEFELKLSQNGPPFIVWGTGVTPPLPPNAKDNNYYYSLTRLAASGAVKIDGTAFDVTGTTWMDHEYGLFGKSGQRPKWILQDMQLDNGVCISNFSIGIPAPATPVDSLATVQRADGTTYFVKTTVTPSKDTWTSGMSGQAYFQEASVALPDFGAILRVKILMRAQEFYIAVPGGSVYEGVATVEGTFEGASVGGTAWMEQTSENPKS